MVLSLLAQMPPTSKPSTPPTIQQSMAKLSDSLDKLQLIVKRLVAKRLAESTANLVPITSQTTITETTTDHVITTQTPRSPSNTPTIDMPPPDTQPSITRPPNNRQQFPIPKPNIQVATYTPPLLPKTNKIVANKPVAEFLNLSIVSITNIQHEVDTHTGVSIPTFIKTMLAIFSCLETIGTRYRYHPPKFVILQTEPKPPWEPCDTRFKTMSLGFRLAHEPGPAKRDPPWGIFIINGRNLGLEDKAVFQDGSIDRSILVTQPI
ncbi:hypothetical protein Tco_0026399 [Tanacetum coccineum]